MTAIAVCTVPLSAMAACIALLACGQTINVMTLAGLTLAIGPMVDSAIICLENTHRHLSMGTKPKEAAFLGASEVAMPELVSTLCTFLVLSPLALMPGRWWGSICSSATCPPSWMTAFNSISRC